MKKKLYILIIFCLLFVFKSNATHIVGGNIGYEYIGEIGNLYRYKVILTTYADCGVNSSEPQPGAIQPIGIYTHDVQNNPTGGVQKQLYATLSMNLIHTVIKSDSTLSCNFNINSCTAIGIYEGFIDLPLNYNGYHIHYERCCRSDLLTNLDYQQGMAFHAYIPPPILENNSPKYNNDPVTLKCVGDTITINNLSFDLDNDDLIYSLVTPLSGVTNTFNIAPPPHPFLPNPIQKIIYESGYTATNIFGESGYCSINSNTGDITFYSNKVGGFVYSVEIKEFRNGNLIGISRCDYNIFVVGNPNAGLNTSKNLIEKYKVFPNPNNGLFEIQNINNIKEISIFNLYGQNVFLETNINSTNENHSIDLTHLSKGTYFIQLTDSNNAIATEKIIIQ